MTKAQNSVKRDPVSELHNDLLGIKGGLEAAAKAICRSAGVLYNKFSEANPHNEVTGREERALAHYVVEKTGSTRYAEAVCADFGGIFIELPCGEPGDDDVLQDYLEIIKQMGALSQEFTDARQDGIVDREEFLAMQLRGRRSIMAILRMLADIELKVRDVPPTIAIVKKVS